MVGPPPFLYALAAFYVALGIEVVHRALKPSCRECLYRHCCPNRQQARVPPCLKRDSAI
jgi:endonuclease III